jgi:hypothetical protein|uniref:hypothetical protein n=1 Tax=Prosthecobacter sp. TaxID=1965333 RepID=UPI003782D8B3
MKRPLLALLLIVSAVSMNSCYGPTPPPRPRGRSLDAPPRYGASPEQNSYFQGTDTIDPNAAATIQPPDPNAAPTGDTVTTPPPTTGATTAPPPVTVTPPGSTPPTTTAPPTPPPATTEIPYATRIAGKPGFVKSPFDPNGQAIDVRDFQSGQKARCPYTGKIFRVP